MGKKRDFDYDKRDISLSKKYQNVKEGMKNLKMSLLLPIENQYHLLPMYNVLCHV